MLRRKLQQQIEKEREQLTQKLGYIETSLHSLESPEHLKRRSPSPPVPHPEPWRKDFRQEMERLEQRKREA